jgi:hypothetical protein
MCGNSMRENREVPRVPVGDRETGRLEKATNHTSNMNALGKSDGRIVPTKPPNNGQELQPAEAVEGPMVGSVPAIVLVGSKQTLMAVASWAWEVGWWAGTAEASL